MTEQISQDIRPRRSALYMPGANARALEKGRTLAADALIMDDSCTSNAEGDGNVVYVYRGGNTTPDDLGSFGEPVTTAPVSSNPEKAGAYTYTVHFLDPGDYTVAFTCQGIDDDPSSDAGSGEGAEAVPDIEFSGQVNASVAQGEGTVNEAPLIE